MVSCGVNNWTLELIVSTKRNPHGDPGAGTLLTLLQCLFVAVATLPRVLSLDVRGCLSVPVSRGTTY